MAQANKLSQKELKQPDSFQSTGEKFLQHFVDYRKQYLLGAVGLLVVFGLAFGIKTYLAKRSAAVSQSFGAALETYLAPIKSEKELKDADEATKSELSFPNEETKYVAAQTKFQEIVEKHGGTTYGKFAAFYVANCLFKTKQYDKARDGYTKFMAEAGSDFADLKFVAENNIAQTYDAEGKLDEALAAYKKIYETPEGVFKDQALYMQAEINQRQGKRDEAVKLYNELLEKFPETDLKSQVEKMLTILGAPKPEPKLDAMLDGAKKAGKGDAAKKAATQDQK